MRKPAGRGVPAVLAATMALVALISAGCAGSGPEPAGAGGASGDPAPTLAGARSLSPAVRDGRAPRPRGSDGKLRSPGEATGADPVMAAVGDIACDPGSASFNAGQGTASRCRQKYTSDLVVTRGPTVFAMLGDSQYSDATLAKYNASYDLSWGRVKAITKPAAGNHEYNTAGAAGYYGYFGSAAGDPAKGYYSYDLGTWHVVVLNSNCSKVGTCAAGSAMEQWLRADLAAQDAGTRCTLAYWHAPRWSSGEHGDNAAVAPLYQALYDSNVDVLLSGHDHNYERFAERAPNGSAAPGRGVRQFVVGTGGDGLRTITAGPHTQASNTTTYGVLFLTLRSGSYSWQFVPEAGKTYTDSGSTTCH